MRVPEIKKTPKALGVALRIRCLGAVLVVFFLPVLLAANPPSWWASGGVLKAGKAADDYAAVNQGQVKNIARAAMNHLDAYCPGGAGGTVHQLLESWNTPTARTDDFSAVNLGQLKALAAPFYDRLIQLGYSNDYPWSNAFWPPDDYAVANIGQVKNLFSFDLSSIDAVHDKDTNTLADWWEIYYFGATGVNPDGMDFGNGQTNAQNQAQGNSAPGVGDGTKVPSGAGTHTGAGSGGSSGGTTGGSGGPGSSNDQNGRVLLVLSGICKQLQVGPETIQTGNTDAMTVVKTISLPKGKSYPITVTDLTGRKKITVYIQVPVGVGFITVPYTYSIDTGKDGSQINDIGYKAIVIPAATSGFIVSDTNSVLSDARYSQNHIVPADGTYAGPMMGCGDFTPSAALKKANSASLYSLDITVDGKHDAFVPIEGGNENGSAVTNGFAAHPDLEVAPMPYGDDQMKILKLATSQVNRPNLVYRLSVTSLNRFNQGGQVKIWTDCYKNEEIKLPHDFAPDQISDTLYVEGVNESMSLKDVQLKFSAVLQGQEVGSTTASVSVTPVVTTIKTFGGRVAFLPYYLKACGEHYSNPGFVIKFDMQTGGVLAGQPRLIQNVMGIWGEETFQPQTGEAPLYMMPLTPNHWPWLDTKDPPVDMFYENSKTEVTANTATASAWDSPTFPVPNDGEQDVFGMTYFRMYLLWQFDDGTLRVIYYEPWSVYWHCTFDFNKILVDAASDARVSPSTPVRTSKHPPKLDGDVGNSIEYSFEDGPWGWDITP